MNLKQFKNLEKREQWWELCVWADNLTGLEDLRYFEAMVEVALDRFNGQTEVIKDAHNYLIVDVTNSSVDHFPTQEVPDYARNIAHANQLMLPDTDYTIKYFKDGNGYAHCRWKVTDKNEFPEYNYVCMEEPQNYSENMSKTTEMAFLTLLIRQRRAKYIG